MLTKNADRCAIIDWYSIVNAAITKKNNNEFEVIKLY